MLGVFRNMSTNGVFKLWLDEQVKQLFSLKTTYMKVLYMYAVYLSVSFIQMLTLMTVHEFLYQVNYE